MKKRSTLFLLLSLVLTFAAIADEDPEFKLKEISVSAKRIERETFQTPNAVSVVDRKQIDRLNSQITPQILRETVGVVAQETTVGQGSPMLRGLTGYQTLIQIDGVRLNNSTFRSGPNQYLATISANGVDRVEVIRGSSSMLYGSGAMGGVISVFTKNPTISGDDKLDLNPRIYGRYSSASQERIGRFELDGSKGQIGFLIGGSFRQYGDLAPGSGYDLHYQNRKFEIVEEKPSDLPEDAWLNEIESPLGWKAFDLDAKIAYRLNDDHSISFAYQMWRQPETPRYDKISTKQYEIYNFAPQDRDLIYATHTLKNLGSAIDQLQTTISFHRQKEGREELKPGKTEVRERFDTVNTIGLGTQAVSTILPKNELIIGAELYFDTIASETIKTDTETKVEKRDQNWGRFPNGSTAMDANFFVQDEIKMIDRVELTVGGRLTNYRLSSDLSSKDPSFGEFKKSGVALTGSVGAVIGVIDGLNAVANFGTAFRSPNLSDTSAVEVTNEGIDAPSPDLDPEKSWTAEVGLKARFSNFLGSATIFHSQITDLVTRVPVNEIYKNDLPKLYNDIQIANPEIDVFVLDNIDQTQIRGIELSGISVIGGGFSVYGNGAVTRGEVLKLDGANPNSENPWESRIRREPPPMGMIGVRWEEISGRFWGDLYFRGAMKQDRLSKGDIRDPRVQGKTRDVKEVSFDENGSAIDAGTPSWHTINLRGGIRLTENLDLNVAIENLLNRRYRVHGSGVDAVGFNVSFSIDGHL